MSTTVTGIGWDLIVPHHARGARMVRQRLAACLADILAVEVLVDAAAVASELVGNAVRHAAPLPGGVIRVAWRLLDGGGLEIRVTDGGSTAAPHLRNPGPDSVTGRGLTIVQALSERWGAEGDGASQCVWAQVRAPV